MKNISNLSNLSANEAKQILLLLLQKSHAHGQAAAHIYTGYSRGLFISSPERQHLRGIAQNQQQHNQVLDVLLRQLHTRPSKLRDGVMGGLGSGLGLLCIFGAHRVPLYSAGWMAAKAVEIHLKTARYAWLANHPEIVPELLDLAEAAWDHATHFKQKLPTPRQNLRVDFARFCQDQHKQRIHSDLQRIKPTP